MFLIQELNSAGIYALKLYVMGIPVTVSVDEFLPFNKESEYGLFYGKFSPDKGLWMPILEKAAAKLYGNYEMLYAGYAGAGIQMMTGAPYYRMFTKNYSVDALWQDIKDKIDKGWMITSSSRTGTGSDKDQDKNGIAYSHEYAVLDAQKLKDGTKLIQVRNPWGHEKYHGVFADTPRSDKWDEYPNFKGYHK